MQVVQVYFVYMDRRNPSQEWGVNYANRNKLWHFLLQSFGACDGSLAKKKIIHFCFVLFCIWERFPISNFRFPISNFPAYIRRGDFTEDFLRYEYGGLYLEGLIFGILRYFPENFRCKLMHCESENFSGSSLHHIFESKNFRFPML